MAPINYFSPFLVIIGFWTMATADFNEVDLLGSIEERSPEVDDTFKNLVGLYLKISSIDILNAILPKNMNSSVHYLLYTPDHPDSPCYLDSNKEALKRCPFNSSLELKILIHGFLEMLLPSSHYFEIKDKMLELYDYNVIIVDWTNYNQPPYIQAAINTLQIGYELTNLIRFLENAKGVDPQSIHLIGHSLGAHIAGVAGDQIPNIKRITGLDPAARFFYPSTYLHRLTIGDADFVDIMHTSNSSHGFGIADPIGDIDFYPNGGESQPKCEMEDEEVKNVKDATALLKSKICHHLAAVLYFLQSIDVNKCVFLAKECDSYENFLDGHCSNGSSKKEKMGLPAEPILGLPPKSKFYLKTSASPPFCLQS